MISQKSLIFSYEKVFCLPKYPAELRNLRHFAQKRRFYAYSEKTSSNVKYDVSSTISRVLYQMIIYLDYMSPYSSFTLYG